MFFLLADCVLIGSLRGSTTDILADCPLHKLFWLQLYPWHSATRSMVRTRTVWLSVPLTLIVQVGFLIVTLFQIVWLALSTLFLHLSFYLVSDCPSLSVSDPDSLVFILQPCSWFVVYQGIWLALWTIIVTVLSTLWFTVWIRNSDCHCTHGYLIATPCLVLSRCTHGPLIVSFSLTLIVRYFVSDWVAD